jgi:hypothetical protein
MARNRLERLADEPDLRLSSKSKEDAWKVIISCIKEEHIIHLIANRNIDIIIICSIYYAVLQDPDIWVDLKIKEIVQVYKNHPQYIEKVSDD